MRHLRFLITMITSLGMLIPPCQVLGENPPKPSNDLRTVKFAYHVRDVVTNDKGVMTARVMSENGIPLGNQKVSLQRGNEVIATALSEPDGDVSFAGLASGLYELNVESSIQYVRLWHPNSAPPIAISQLLLVRDRDVERAQQDFCGSLLGQEPVMIGVLIAAGIAIPLAVHESGS